VWQHGTYAYRLGLIDRKALQDKEVYRRLSGTLWLGSPWAVTTNKMTLMENATVRD
jgi:hypothetical protein